MVLAAGMGRGVGLGVALGVCAACVPSREIPAPPPMQRLLPDLGDVSLQRLSDQTRPATLLPPGTSRACEVRVARESRLVYAVGAVDPPSRGRARLTVKAGDAVVDQVELDFARRDRWWRRGVDLPGEGAVRLSFFGESLASEENGVGTGWSFAIGAPRIYHGGRPGRVLLWISQDALRADHLSLYGYHRATSPVVDALARDWTVFDSASATSSWTLPSMASQMTGQSPTRHGAVLHTLQVDPSATTVFEALAAEGFTVVGVTANDLISRASGLARGFDTLIYLDARAEELNRRLDVILREWGGGDLAIFMHYMDPHAPYVPPETFGRRFDARWDEGPLGTSFHELSLIRDPARVRRVIDLYDAEIAYADHAIGAMIASLRTQGLTQRAVIAYTADHGEELQDHGGWHHGGTLYEEVLHVPLALRIPGVAGRRMAAPVSLVGLAPTLLESLGVARPASMTAESWLSLIRGERRAAGPVFAETVLTPDHQPKASVRHGLLKYVTRVAQDGRAGPGSRGAELFDLAQDPQEQHNRAGAPDETRLRALLARHLTDAREAASEPVPSVLEESTLEKLRELGYVQ